MTGVPPRQREENKMTTCEPGSAEELVDQICDARGKLAALRGAMTAYADLLDAQVITVEQVASKLRGLADAAAMDCLDGAS